MSSIFYHKRFDETEVTGVNLGFANEEERNLEYAPDKETHDDDSDDNQASKDGEASPAGCPERRSVVNTKKLGRGEIGDEEIATKFVTRRVFVELRGPAIEVAGAIPSPTVFDGKRLADGRDGSIDIAVWVLIVSEIRFGGLNRGIGGAKVLVFEIERPGAEDDGLSAVALGDINDDVRKNEVLKFDKTLLNRGIIIRGVSVEHGTAQIGHFQMVEAKKSGGHEG